MHIYNYFRCLYIYIYIYIYIGILHKCEYILSIYIYIYIYIYITWITCGFMDVYVHYPRFFYENLKILFLPFIIFFFIFLFPYLFSP